MSAAKLKVMVLAGGPDRERPVSLQSGAQVTQALRDAGHDVLQHDINATDLSALDQFDRWPGDVVFPVLHGSWGEGGALQAILESRGVSFVGCGAKAADLCMDKYRTKQVLNQNDLPTPAFELLATPDAPTLEPPVVLKALREGSSIDLVICHDPAKLLTAVSQLQQRHRELLVERYIQGKEITVGVIGDAGRERALPPIRIIPADEYYTYEAKYLRDDTKYELDPARIGLSPPILTGLQELAVKAFRALGCRHMSRVDFIVDQNDQPWILEVNTIPGFTSHSLLPKAAAHAGIPLPQLVDQLVQMAAAVR